MKELNEQEFIEFIKGDSVVVDFWAAWCMPCRMLTPILEQLDKDYPNTQIAKLNVDDFPSISNQYSIRGVPTIVHFKNGKEVNRIVGVKSSDEMGRIFGL